ncbi:hypothetical protein ScPMuIL_003795 [Solemya velum]
MTNGHKLRLLREQRLLRSAQFCVGNCRSNSTESLAAPSLPDQPKQYSPKLHSIVEDIGKLTLLEVSDLNSLLKERLNIPDAPMMAVGAAPAKEEEEEEDAAPKKQKMAFTVKLVKFDDTKKIALIKEMKNLLEGMNLVQAKKFVESLPQVVKADIGKEEAEKLKAAVESAGGVVELE